MALAFVQTKSVNGPGNPTTVTFTSNIVTGHLIVVGVSYSTSSGSVSGVTDNIAGSPNTYVLAKALSSQSNSLNTEIWYCASATAGASAPTISVTGASIASFVVGIYEFSGQATSSIADGSGASGTGTGTSLALTTTFTTTNANDLLFAVCNQANTGTAGPSGWTTETTFFSYAYDIVAAASTYTATFTQTPTGAYTSVAYAFKAAASGSVPSASVNPRIYLP